jgi:magnesium-transporting ATPase (P-type)
MEETIAKENSFEEFENIKKRRRKMLPWWIKVFCWIFMLFGLLSIVCLILGFTNIKPALAFYGFETNEPFSLNGLIVITIGILKGITAFALWFEKDFAIKIGKIDAIIGIVLCAISMLVLPLFQDGFNITIRLELALLIPYLIKLNKIQKGWESTI